ncbi:acetate--CoA ligase family protein [Roseiarcaceae bacterium H3SJ34-1]|uniref:acetate--CoA ligase family protein n=1 Tax=Terripilifer ovatus TaxID=3032367 RepID=UPI003AB92D03|nr:acetate--CoA ligase family protein [Roseiarcaceae bacterium H3SJ34-1]
MQTSKASQTGAFPAPKTIAVAGASAIEGGNYYGARVLANLVEGGIDATIYPVNPRLAGSRLLELQVYASLSDLPSTPDMVFVVTPVKFVIPTLEEAAALGVGMSVVLVAESGGEDERRRFRERIAEIARTSRMRIIGPNSMGVMNGNLSLNGSFASGTAGGRVPPGSIACLSQSGATISAMLQWFGDATVGFSWLISTGDESATGMEELLQAMVEDPTVRSIMLFLEGVGDGAAFRRAALGARLAGKPVTLLQVGKSDRGREAVQSHTGRVAGTREVFAAVAAETGIIETESFEEFFSTGRTMAQRPQRPDNLPRNRRAAVVTVSGGAASLAADQLAAEGWDLADFSRSMVAALAQSTGQAGLHNPADIGGVWRAPEKIGRAIATIAEDSSIDTIFISLGAGGVFADAVARAIVCAAAAVTQDVFVVWVGISAQVNSIFERAGIPAFGDFPLALRAAEAGAKFSASQAGRKDAEDLMRLLSTAPASMPAHRAAASQHIWTVTEALGDLRQAGLPCAPFDVAAALDPKDIAGRAERIGFPVVLKLSSPDMNHKSDDGGVAIRLCDQVAVEAAVAAFQTVAARKRLTATSVLVQKMEQGVEILVGIKRDPSFGSVLVVGLGGTLAELHAEVAAATLPTTPSFLRKLLSRNSRLNLLLDGYRGQPAVNREALVSFLADVARWALSKDERLLEVDLNPVMISGERISIVDARAVWN